MAEQPHACGRSTLKAKGTEMAYRCLKSSPSTTALRHWPWAGHWDQHSSLWIHADDPTSSSLFWLQLLTNFPQRGKKKEFSWTPHFSFSEAPICLLGWDKSNREDQRGPPTSTSMLVPEQLFKASPPICSHLIYCRLGLPLKANIVLPRGTGLTALAIQLANMWRRWWAWGRQQGWHFFPHGESALPMHPVPAREEITHPEAIGGLAHTLKPGTRLQLLTGHPGCCFQKAPDTTGSHMPVCWVTLWKQSWKWDLRLTSVFIPPLFSLF